MRSLPPSKRLLALFLFIPLFSPLLACKQQRQVEGQALPVPEKQYPAGPEGLKSLWTDILVAAQKDEREKVHDLMASMIMTDADLNALFGPQRGAWLKPRYLPMVSRMANIGAMELVSQIADRKYDDIEIFTTSATSSDPAERVVFEALVEKVPVYGVRVKQKTETRGLRYDFFVYREGRWVTGNQISKYLMPPDAGAPAHAPLPDGARAAPAGTAPVKH